MAPNRCRFSRDFSDSAASPVPMHEGFQAALSIQMTREYLK